MRVNQNVTFWSTVISYKKAINLGQNRLVLHTKIRKHCASTTCLNGSQIFELGTAITLGVYLGPPCRLVCTRVIENSAWHGAAGPAAAAGSGTSCEPWWGCSLSDSPLTPVSMGCVGQKCYRPCWLENFAPSQNPCSHWQCWGGSPYGCFCFEASEL